MIRRASSCLVVSSVALLLLTGVAAAVPTVTFKAAFVPIGGSPETANTLDTGAAVQSEWTIHGSENRGFPPSLVGLSLDLPEGTAVRPEGFPTCPRTALENVGPSACPNGSRLSGSSDASGLVPLGNALVGETISAQGFFSPGGGLELYMRGTTPKPIEFIAPIHVINGSSPSIDTTIPGAQAVPFQEINVQLGAAYQQSGKTVSYVTVPTTCPTGGFVLKSEMLFASVAGLPPAAVTTRYTAPCPPKGVNVKGSVPETAVPGTGGAVTAPSNKRCLSGGHLTIHVLKIRGLSYRKMIVYVNGHRVKVVKGARIITPLDLRGLPKGRYTVRVTVTTTSGRRITGARAYHACPPKPLP